MGTLLQRWGGRMKEAENACYRGEHVETWANTDWAADSAFAGRPELIWRPRPGNHSTAYKQPAQTGSGEGWEAGAGDARAIGVVGNRGTGRRIGSS
jgi:hypothetical protein